MCAAADDDSERERERERERETETETEIEIEKERQRGRETSMFLSSPLTIQELSLHFDHSSVPLSTGGGVWRQGKLLSPVGGGRSAV